MGETDGSVAANDGDTQVFGEAAAAAGLALPLSFGMVMVRTTSFGEDVVGNRRSHRQRDDGAGCHGGRW